jgi:hypothetical protein
VNFTKCCTKCQRQLDVEQFRVRTDKTLQPRSARCLDCERADCNERARRRRSSGVERVFAGYNRCAREKVCDDALNGWRAVGDAAFQGARL